IATGFGFAAGIERGIASHRALRTNGRLRLQFPRACTKAEVSCGQCADGTDVGGIAGEDGIESGVGERNDLCIASTLVEAKHRFACDLILEADATRALNAAFAIEPDQFAKGNLLFEMKLLIVDEAAFSGAKSHCQVLKRAFAAFITDR